MSIDREISMTVVPSSLILRMRASRCSFLGLPTCFPAFLDAAIPALILSTMESRSNEATAKSMDAINRPVLDPKSMFSETLTTLIP